MLIWLWSLEGLEKVVTIEEKYASGPYHDPDGIVIPAGLVRWMK